MQASIHSTRRKTLVSVPSCVAAQRALRDAAYRTVPRAASALARPRGMRDGARADGRRGLFRLLSSVVSRRVSVSAP